MLHTFFKGVVVVYPRITQEELTGKVERSAAAVDRW
jgi:hypothetical protein